MSCVSVARPLNPRPRPPHNDGLNHRSIFSAGFPRSRPAGCEDSAFRGLLRRNPRAAPVQCRVLVRYLCFLELVKGRRPSLTLRAFNGSEEVHITVLNRLQRPHVDIFVHSCRAAGNSVDPGMLQIRCVRMTAT